MGNEEQWLPSASCRSDRAPVENVSMGMMPLEHASVEPRMSNLASIGLVGIENVFGIERAYIHQAIRDQTAAQRAHGGLR